MNFWIHAKRRKISASRLAATSPEPSSNSYLSIWCLQMKYYLFIYSHIHANLANTLTHCFSWMFVSLRTRSWTARRRESAFCIVLEACPSPHCLPNLLHVTGSEASHWWLRDEQSWGGRSAPFHCCHMIPASHLPEPHMLKSCNRLQLSPPPGLVFAIPELISKNTNTEKLHS